MNRYREPAICRHIKAIRDTAPPFCNHYSYKFDFVNYLCVLGFLDFRTRLSYSKLLDFGYELRCSDNANPLILFQIKQVTVS